MTKKNLTTLKIEDCQFASVDMMLKIVNDEMERVIHDYDSGAITKADRNLANDYLANVYNRIAGDEPEEPEQKPEKKPEPKQEEYPSAKDTGRPHRRKGHPIPGRYAVGRMEDHGIWCFYAGTDRDGEAQFTYRPCEAKLYESYRTADACCDFIDDRQDWEVLDWWKNMTEEERHYRSIFANPEDDEGNDSAVRLVLVR